MPDLLPDRLYHPLYDLAQRWRVGMSDLRQWLSEGVMTPVVWLPVMSVVELTIESGGETDPLRHWKGYVRMSEHQCRRVFRHGSIALREFSTLDGERNFRLPETSDDWIITLEDLVILEAERKRMEGKYPGLINQLRHDAESKVRRHQNAIDPTYRIVRVDGHEFRFGETQAKILRRLADATTAGEPWQNGKILLREADSQSFSLSNLFKRNPVWKQLIISNGRGFYKLNDRFRNPHDLQSSICSDHLGHGVGEPEPASAKGCGIK